MQVLGDEEGNWLADHFYGSVTAEVLSTLVPADDYRHKTVARAGIGGRRDGSHHSTAFLDCGASLVRARHSIPRVRQKAYPQRLCVARPQTKFRLNFSVSRDLGLARGKMHFRPPRWELLFDWAMLELFAYRTRTGILNNYNLYCP